MRLLHLARLDARLAAHLDGLKVAGEAGSSLCVAALEEPNPGKVFAAAVGSIERHDQAGLARLHALTGAAPELQGGLIAAFGWVERGALQGIVSPGLSSTDPATRLIAVAACGLHRVDPGLISAGRLGDAVAVVRARALRTAGEIGLIDALRSCSEGVGDPDPDSQFWAAWSGVLLGDRQRALDTLTRFGFAADHPHRARAFKVALQAMSPADAHKTLQQLGGKPDQLRWLIQGSGINGDPTYVPWLIKHMSDDKIARLAGEAFSLITGTDLALLDLERKPPENIDAGPNDNPDDENVEMDPDEGLPWPDAQRVSAWWEKNSSRFQPGARHFMGAPVTREHCIDVLKNGYQRQRILAAHYLCLLQPGTPLFNTSAPAWRQQKLLAQIA
jgi:uncharacterized protein (TIGR02270 family)